MMFNGENVLNGNIPDVDVAVDPIEEPRLTSVGQRNALSVVNIFFQAEVGIRDVAVTGVQTCALPIYRVPRLFDRAGAEIEKAGHPVRYGTKDECELRRVQQLLAFKDPTGNKIEIVVRPFHGGERYFPARDAGITHFSHIGLRTSDAPRDETFWTRLLNARVSDWIGDAPLLRVNTIHP